MRSTPGSWHAQRPEQVEGQVAVAAHGPAQLDVRPRADEAGGRVATGLHVGQDLTGLIVQVVHVVGARQPGVEPQVLERGLGGGAGVVGPGGVQPRPPGVIADGRPGVGGQAFEAAGEGGSAVRRGSWKPMRTTASKCMRQVPGPPPIWVAVGS